MFLTRLYYTAKPWLPWRLRMALRRVRARSIRQRCNGSWPIDERAGDPPDGWPGWPEEKQFALVLTHDVESEAGLSRVRQLAELERQLGFRSSFNFIPKGPYTLPPPLQAWLLKHGFEVGVHDLYHDGKLFRSRRRFREGAVRINQYVEAWGAAGFRSAFMLKRLDWIHDLQIQYDASSFDTDPFEPQPDGVSTIFPFWIPGPNGNNAVPGAGNGKPSGQGYMELPYTLVQDITLFLLLREPGIEIWKRKLDWIAQRGGMALLITHPDYMEFDSAPNTNSGTHYPAKRYTEFLHYVRTQYAGQYWHALPKAAAAAFRK